MMKKTVFLWVCFCMLLFQVSAASSSRQELPDTHTLRVTDGLDREITLPSPPEEIVLAGRANVFLVNAVYLFESASRRVQAAAETDQGMGDFFPLLDPRWEEKDRLPNDAGAEEVVTLSPDLVIMKDSMYERLGPQLESLSVPVLTLGLETHEQYLRDIRLLGEILDEQERAQSVITYMTDYVDTVRERSSRTGDTPRVLMLYHAAREGTETFHIPPADWIQTYMTETAGGKAVWKDMHRSGGWQAVHFEQIARWNPDMLFLISYTQPSSEVLDAVSDSKRWRELNAYREGNILAFPGDFHSWAQSDIRWLLGLQWLAKQLHPEEFSDVDMEDEVLRFYRFMYKIPEETIREAVLPRLKEELPGRKK